MKPSSLPALLLVTALVCAAPAAAKELTKVTLCGQNDKCAAITDADKLRQVPRGGATSIPAPPPQPFYTLTLSIDHGDESGPLLIYYLPRNDLLAANGEEPGEMVWLSIADPQGKEILRQATKDLDPFPAPNAWPQELESHYRVIPDDQTPRTLLPPSAASPAGLEAAPIVKQDEGTTAVWLYGVVALGLAALASLAYSRRRHGRPLLRFGRL